MAAPMKDLEELLSSMFSTDELRRFLRHQGGAVEALVEELPENPIPKASFMHEAARQLNEKGVAKPAFFEALIKKVPGRRADIEAVAAASALNRATAKSASAAPAVAPPPVSKAVGSTGPAAPTAPPDPNEDPKVRDLRELIAKRQVVVIVGAGASLAATNGLATAGWTGLLRSGVAHCQSFGGADERWARLRHQLLDEGEVSDWIDVAQAITKKLQGPKGGAFKAWLREVFGPMKATDTSLLQAIAELGCPIATTNYDLLLESVTGLRAVSWDEDGEVERVLRGDEPGILHLHGHWKDPEHLVFGSETYIGVRDNPYAQTVRHALRTTKSLLFIGCGETTDDPNIGAWLRWSGEVFAGAESRSYRLERDSKVAKVQAEHPAVQRLYVVGFGPEHTDLPAFVRRLAPRAGGAEVP